MFSSNVQLGVWPTFNIECKRLLTCLAIRLMFHQLGVYYTFHSLIVAYFCLNDLYKFTAIHTIQTFHAQFVKHLV